jgi:hypothetical protein
VFRCATKAINETNRTVVTVSIATDTPDNKKIGSLSGLAADDTWNFKDIADRWYNDNLEVCQPVLRLQDRRQVYDSLKKPRIDWTARACGVSYVGSS